MKTTFRIYPVGAVRKRVDRVEIEIYPMYKDALLGLEKFSYIIVLYWFHESDDPEKRSILQVHPKRDKRKPLTGVFATRSPARPNPIAISFSKIIEVRENVVVIEKTDANDNTPVIDIKPYIPASDAHPEAGVVDWLSN